MPHDDILAEIGADWRRQTVDHERLRLRIAQRQRRTRVQLAAKLAGTIVAALAGAWLAFLAVAESSLTFGFAALILIAALPLMVIEILATRRLTLVGTTDTPEGAVRAARDQAAASLRLLWAPRVAALVLGVGAAGLIALHGLEGAEPAELAWAAPIWLVAAVATWWWQAHRAHRLATEISNCDRLLEELGEA